MKKLQMISHIGDATSVTVHFEYTPHQPARYDADYASPAVRESVCIGKITIVNDDIGDDLSCDTFDRIELECLAHVHDLRDTEMERAANQ